ncbi:hypothetical protein [Streptomyces sp. NPDC007205]|uniref:hypothetical protein n=1 Tax=Streptomyces sp. NPDC007205 TaxID=3154316 RepID=UPI0033E35B78
MSDWHAAAALTAAAVIATIIATILVARAVVLHESGRVACPTHRARGRATSGPDKAALCAVALSDDAAAFAVREAEQHVHHCWQQLQTRVDPPE